MFEVLPEVVIAVDPELNVRYVNPFARRMTGLGDEVVGVSMIEILHPEDMGRAAEVAALILDGSLGAEVTPATYRVATAIGEWLSVEVTATPPVRLEDGTDRIVILGRYSGDTMLRNRIFAMLTQGRPSDEIIDLLPGYGTWRYPDAHYVVSYPSSPGNWRHVGSDLGVELLERFDGLDTPWAQARREGEALVGWNDLSGELRDVAIEQGLHACMVMPVPLVNASDVAIALAWSTNPHESVSAHRYALEQMAEALDVVLQWRGHVTELERAARIDDLSGVVNRAVFIELFEAQLERAATTGATVAVLYVDLDHFKAINDECGHAVGDEVIKAAASRMNALVRADDLVGRIGGDEFAVLCPDVSGMDEVAGIAERIVGALSQPFEHDGRRLLVGASVGVAMADSGSIDHTALLAEADRALYYAKSEGRGRWHLA